MHSNSNLMIATTIGRQIALEISNGRLLPGEIIDLDTVASEFNALRADVLRAVVELSEQGLLCIHPDHGIVVSRLSIAEFLATLELLAELEGSCAKLATRRMRRVDADAIQAAHQASRECLQTGDVLRYARGNAAFHEVLYRACDNDALVKEISRIRARTQVYRRSPFQSRLRMRNSWHEHGRILQAVLARDERAATERMVEHVSQGAQELVAHLLQGASELLAQSSDFPGRRSIEADRTASTRPVANAMPSTIVRPAPQPFTQTVRGFILSRQYFKATLDEAADALGMSKRTLTRQLSAEDTSFQALKDDIRREQAIDAIGNSSESIAQIAHDLGFSDASSFYRAFRNWTGTTPCARGASNSRRENPRG